MKFNINLSIDEARLIRLWIRRSIYEQYERNMNEAGLTKDETRNKSYDCISAFNTLDEELGKNLNNKKKEIQND